MHARSFVETLQCWKKGGKIQPTSQQVQCKAQGHTQVAHMASKGGHLSKMIKATRRHEERGLATADLVGAEEVRGGADPASTPMS
jgi:hypothetical protein